MMNLEQLISWLGVEGAIAGLEASDLSVQELLEMLPINDTSNSSRLKRSELIQKLVFGKRHDMTKSKDELIQMDQDSLKEYFLKVKLSKKEIIEILASMDIRPGSIARNNLIEFAAREISDIGMYSRVAKGDGIVSHTSDLLSEINKKN